MKQISADHIKSLRRDIDIMDVIRTLEIPLQNRGRRVTFRCPACSGFHTALNPERNRAYCFKCTRSFNTIDLVMAERNCNFLEAVGLLECILT
jgi:DNA primase